MFTHRKHQKMRDTSNIPLSTWEKWILEAIRRIRSQKQRPSVQRICQAIGSHHKFHEDIVAEKLEMAVNSGAVLKVYNKGLHSYKAPNAMQRRKTSVNMNSDLAALVTKAVRDLGEYDGSNIRSIENYVQQSNNLVLDEEVDFKHVIKNSLKSAVEQKLLKLEGKFYKVGAVPLTPKKKIMQIQKKRNNKDAEISIQKVSFYEINLIIFFLNFKNSTLNRVRNLFQTCKTMEKMPVVYVHRANPIQHNPLAYNF